VTAKKKRGIPYVKRADADSRSASACFTTTNWQRTVDFIFLLVTMSSSWPIPQISLSALSDELAQVKTHKKEFLNQIDRIVPWDEWVAIIKLCYYKGECGNKPYDLELMLQIHILQNLHNLTDEATTCEVIDSRAFSEFCRVESSNQVPDGDTIGRFRNILVRSGLEQKIFAQIVILLQKKGLLLKKGTIVDFTFIEASSSVCKSKFKN
jgi:IS5 family transposase